MGKVERGCKTQQKYNFLRSRLRNFGHNWYFLNNLRLQMQSAGSACWLVWRRNHDLKTGTVLQQSFILSSSHQLEFVWLNIEISYCSFSFFFHVGHFWSIEQLTITCCILNCFQEGKMLFSLRMKENEKRAKNVNCNPSVYGSLHRKSSYQRPSTASFSSAGARAR